MKTMTCKELGGACELALSGATADDVIKLQDKHLKEVVAAGDEVHKPAADAMKARWRRPLKGMAWYRQVKRDFESAPAS